MKNLVILVTILAFVGLLAFCGGNKAGKEAEKQTQEASKKLTEVAKGFQEMGKQIKKSAEKEKNIELVDYKVLKSILPDFEGWKKGNVKGEKSSIGAFSLSKAEATYTRENSSINLEITDAAKAKIMMAPVFMFKTVKVEKESDTGYEKTFQEKNYFGHEEWDKKDKSGKIVMIYGDRFVISADGNDIESMDVLKSLISKIDLSKLK